MKVVCAGCKGTGSRSLVFPMLTCHHCNGKRTIEVADPIPQQPSPPPFVNPERQVLVDKLSACIGLVRDSQKKSEHLYPDFDTVVAAVILYTRFALTANWAWMAKTQEEYERLKWKKV